MTLDVDYCDMEKYYLKWLRVLSYVERTCVQVLCMSFMCYLMDYYFNNMLIMMSDIIIL